MGSASYAHIPEVFLAAVKENPAKPMLYEKQSRMFVGKQRREVAGMVNACARLLHSLGVGPERRVALCGLGPSLPYWVTECATLMLHSTAVIIPRSFAPSERMGLLAESCGKVAVVETSADAQELLQSLAALPQLTHIICLSGSTQGAISVINWEECLTQGRVLPDQTSDLLSTLTPAHTALLFYRNEKRGHKAIRYEHGHLLAHAQAMRQMIGNDAIGESDVILTSPSWDAPVEHIASCYLPLLYGASIQINVNTPDFVCLEHHPNVLVAPSSYSARLQGFMEHEIKSSGRMEWEMFCTTISYGKRKFERQNKIGWLRRSLDGFLKATVVKKITKKLGGKLRLIVGTDDAAKYDTQLFFHTFGVDLVDIPDELFRPE